MSSTRPVDPGGKGNPFLEDISYDVPQIKDYLFSQCNPQGKKDYLNGGSSKARPEGGLNPILSLRHSKLTPKENSRVIKI